MHLIAVVGRRRLRCFDEFDTSGLYFTRTTTTTTAAAAAAVSGRTAGSAPTNRATHARRPSRRRYGF